MGQEIEYKLRAENPAQLMEAYQRVMQSAENSGERRIVMATRYFDTPARDLEKQKWMLRIRKENERQVLTCKTPQGEYTRGEWNLSRSSSAPVPQPEELDALVAMGAPMELSSLSGLAVVCEAHFIRRCTMLRLPDGTRIELAADEGQLLGQTEQEDFYELELELYGGSENRLQELAKLAGLPEEHRSKSARAFRLR